MLLPGAHLAGNERWQWASTQVIYWQHHGPHFLEHLDQGGCGEPVKDSDGTSRVASLSKGGAVLLGTTYALNRQVIAAGHVSLIGSCLGSDGDGCERAWWKPLELSTCVTGVVGGAVSTAKLRTVRVLAGGR